MSRLVLWGWVVVLSLAVNGCGRWQQPHGSIVLDAADEQPPRLDRLVEFREARRPTGTAIPTWGDGGLALNATIEVPYALTQGPAAQSTGRQTSSSSPTHGGPDITQWPGPVRTPGHRADRRARPPWSVKAVGAKAGDTNPVGVRGG